MTGSCCNFKFLADISTDILLALDQNGRICRANRMPAAFGRKRKGRRSRISFRPHNIPGFTKCSTTVSASDLPTFADSSSVNASIQSAFSPKRGIAPCVSMILPKICSLPPNFAKPQNVSNLPKLLPKSVIGNLTGNSKKCIGQPKCTGFLA